MLEPYVGGEVEYVQMKKMKKRRDLNALVNNGKAKLGIGKRKKKGQHELLQNQDTESSEIDEFSVDQEKAFVRNRGREPESKACSRFCWVIVCLLLLLCIGACAGLGWVHLELKKDLDSLRTKLSKVESGNEGTSEDFEDLKKRVKGLETSKSFFDTQLNDVRHGTKGLDEISTAVSGFKEKITTLESASSHLKESIASAPALQSVPAKVDTLTKSVASVQGDLHTVSDQVKTIDTRVTKLEENNKIILQRLSALESEGTAVKPTERGEDEEKKNSSDDSTVGSKSLEDVLVSLQAVQRDVENNKMDIEHISNITKGVSLRLELIEQSSTTHSTVQDQVTTADWVTIVNNAVQKAMETARNKTATPPPTQPVTNTSSVVLDDAVVTQLTEQITNITTLLEIYQSQTQQLKKDFNLAHNPHDDAMWNATQTDMIQQLLEHTMDTYKNTYNLDMKAVRSSVNALNETVHQLDSRVSSNNNQITALATTIQQLAQSAFHNDLLPGPVQVTGPTSSESSNSSQPAGTPPPSTIVPDANARKTVRFWNYNTPEELEIGHSRWDEDGDGKVNPDILPDFFGPHITDEDLDNYRKFDLDGDGLLNLDETMMAAGFKPVPGDGVGPTEPTGTATQSTSSPFKEKTTDTESTDLATGIESSDVATETRDENAAGTDAKESSDNESPVAFPGLHEKSVDG